MVMVNDRKNMDLIDEQVAVTAAAKGRGVPATVPVHARQRGVHGRICGCGSHDPAALG
jgi:hypothetical protein